MHCNQGYDAGPMKAILDIGVLCVIVLMMGAVGMDLEERRLRAVIQRKGLPS